VDHKAVRLDESLMVAPTMWRKFFAARYRGICDEVHRHEMHVVFHSCGNVTAIIGDLIEACHTLS
jgi:hypothetical protein